jgi:DNA polymerase I
MYLRILLYAKNRYFEIYVFKYILFIYYIILLYRGPVGNGQITCISIYGGPEVIFGTSPSASDTSPENSLSDTSIHKGYAIWIDNLGEGKNSRLLDIFKNWFENEEYKKVWHNYAFDRHVMYNEGEERRTYYFLLCLLILTSLGINCLGFHGDTMHMARLWDTARERPAGI